MNTIAVTADGTLKCQCGNVPESAGFDPCDATGAVDDSLLDANSTRPVHYVCNMTRFTADPWSSSGPVMELDVSNESGG
jgi:hypothetical protein